MKNWMKSRVFPFVLAAVLIALLWVSGLGQGTWQWRHLEKNGLDFGDAPNKTFALDGGAQHGVLCGGPGFSLRAGTYRLHWSILADADNRFLITASNGARIEPAEIAIPADEWGSSASFTLLDDAENLQIQILFEKGGSLAVHEVSMSMACSDRFFLLALLILAAAALAAAERAGLLTPQRKKTLLILAAAVLIASVPALRENLNAGHDSEFHRMRLRNTVSALAQGQFPVRVGGSMYNGYGSATSIFYPDLWLVGPALMMLAGATIQLAMSVLIVAVNAVTALCAYACGRRIFKDDTAGLCAAVLYTLASYRLTDVYTRMALGEAAAMAVIPLFLLGLWEVVCGDKKRWPLLAFAATAVFQSHMISTVLCAVLAAAVCAGCIVRIVRGKRLAAIAKAVLAALLLNLFYLVPLADSLLGGVSMGALHSSVSQAALSPVELFAADPAFPKDIGTALLLCAVAACCALTGRRDGRAKTARVLLLAGAAMALMATDLFPWAAVESRMAFAVNFLQFPWRLLMFADLFLALGCGWGLACMAKGEQWKEILPPAVLALCVLAVSPQIARYAVEENNAYICWKSNSQMITAYAEYTLPDTALDRTIDCSVLTDGDAQVTAYEKRGTQVRAQVSAQAGGAVSLPLFGFDGYRAELDGKEIAWRLGENNRLTVDLPAGTQGELGVSYSVRPLWRAADAVSLLAAVLLAAKCFFRRKGEEAEHMQK